MDYFSNTKHNTADCSFFDASTPKPMKRYSQRGIPHSYHTYFVNAYYVSPEERITTRLILIGHE